MADQKFEVNCGFFDSVNKDRLYTAAEMNRPYKRVITNGVFATPSGTPSTDLQVVSAQSGMNIIVKAGEGLFGDKWFENPTDIAITVPTNTALTPRRDSVIVQIDNTQSGRVGNIVYRQGTPSSNPMPPNIGTVTDVIEYRLANIYVAANAAYIGQDAITDLRGSSECPWITSLIKQVDTSTLYAQWQAAYQKYFDNSTEDFDQFEETRKAEWDQFVHDLTEDLTVSTNVIMLTNNYVSAGVVTNIPIGIPSYDPDTDVLMVFANGLKMTEGVNYTINSNKTSIDLKVELTAGQTVNFLVLKSVIAADIQTTITMIQELNDKIADVTKDSGWIQLALENGTSFDSTTTPSVRMVGDRVYIRGALKGVVAANTKVATLPASMIPSANYQFSSNVFINGGITAQVVFEVNTAGQLILIAAAGTIGATSMLPISTDYVIG